MKAVSITVLMPVYNAGQYLAEAIESILAQTFTDFEFIIINDGSTDNSEEIIKRYQDPRISYYKNDTNLKLIATLNKGIALSAGKYIARMDADDISLPLRLERQFSFMESHSEVTLCGTWFESFGDESKINKYEADLNLIRLKMLYQTQFCHPSVIIRKSALQEINPPFDFDYPHAEDYDLFSKLTYGSVVTNLPEVLVKYRTHTDSVSRVYKDIQVTNSIKIRISNFSRIGLEVSKQEVINLEMLAYQQYGNLITQVDVVKNLLLKIAHADTKNAGIEHTYRVNFCVTLWFNLCYNLIGMKKEIPEIFFSSVITRKYISGWWKLKFYIKWRTQWLRRSLNIS